MGKNYNSGTDECVNRYFKDIKDSQPLTLEEEMDLARRIQSGDESAVEELVFANLKFVVSIAKEFQGNGIDLIDLINDGNEGLIKAAMKFEPRGFRFISYAVWWIKQSIKFGLNENARTVKLPVNIINKLSQIRKHVEKFEFSNERKATHGDILFEDEDTLITFEDNTYPVCSSLNSSMNEDGDEFSDLIVGTTFKSPDEIDSYTQILNKELNKALGCLTDRERKIVEMYFGLNTEDGPQNLDTIGELFGITKERVRQIKEKAIRKLRHNSSNFFNLY